MTISIHSINFLCYFEYQLNLKFLYNFNALSRSPKDLRIIALSPSLFALYYQTSTLIIFIFPTSNT